MQKLYAVCYIVILKLLQVEHWAQGLLNAHWRRIVSETGMSVTIRILEAHNYGHVFESLDDIKFGSPDGHIVYYLTLYKAKNKRTAPKIDLNQVQVRLLLWGKWALKVIYDPGKWGVYQREHI